jgi:hypothetical protein
MTQPKAAQWQSVTTDDLDATIATGQTVSNAIDLQGTFLVGLIIPANFDGTQLQWEVSRDGITFYEDYNAAGTRMTATVTPGKACSFSAQDFAMWRFIKLVSVTTQATTDTIIGLVTRPLA